MSSNRYLYTDKYKKFLLNRVTVSPGVVEYLENCIATDEEANKYCFHKIMIHNWLDDADQLFDTLSSYFTSTFIPIHYSVFGELTTFYVENFKLILKIVKFDFIFPYSRNMFSIDILLNDKTSMDFFGELLTLDNIVSNVVSQRFTQKCELDLSNFCEDQEFIKKKVCFYKLALLPAFKILMLRMGRDTKTLNLSNNKLSHPPLEVLNFFIKADLTAINLSNNNIASIANLHRVSSKIEKLWIEGNPLCQIDPVTYIKNVTMKFPRLNELDGVPINLHSLIFPFVRNYLSSPDEKTKYVVNTFLMLYFSHYDSPDRKTYLAPFYNNSAELSIATNIIADMNDTSLDQYMEQSRNIANLTQSELKHNRSAIAAKCFKGRDIVLNVHNLLPPTIHDPTTFTVDVLMHDSQFMTLVVDGMFKQNSTATSPEHIFHFRRTFVFTVRESTYIINNEMYFINFATVEQIKSSFKNPIINMNVLQLINPTSNEADPLIIALQHITQLKKSEVELRLKYHNWDVVATLKDLVLDLRSNRVLPEVFLEDDFSDTSSLLDELE